MKVAIYGGSFNPPTLAHEAVSRACLDVSGIDEVWLMPSGTRLDKPYSIDDVHRLAMVGLMSRRIGDRRLQVSRFELDLERPSKTIKTLGALSVAYPNVDPYFVLGADSYWTMPTSAWVDGDYLQKNLHMLIVPREQYPNPNASNVGILHIGEEFRGVSSSEARAKAQAGESIANIVDPWVEEYIADHGLYGYNRTNEPIPSHSSEL